MMIPECLQLIIPPTFRGIPPLVPTRKKFVPFEQKEVGCTWTIISPTSGSAYFSPHSLMDQRRRYRKVKDPDYKTNNATPSIGIVRLCIIWNSGYHLNIVFHYQHASLYTACNRRYFSILSTADCCRL